MRLARYNARLAALEAQQEQGPGLTIAEADRQQARVEVLAWRSAQAARVVEAGALTEAEAAALVARLPMRI